MPRPTAHSAASRAAFGASDVVGTVLLFGPDTRLTATEWAGHYGSSVQAVFPDRTEIVRAFLQPVTSRSWQNMDHMIPTGGEVPRGQFLYIGPPELDIRGAEHLYLAGRYFLVRRADMIVFDDAELFLWGLCVEGGREDPWSS